MAVTPGTRFGPYEIVSSLGAGGMGEVYRARDVIFNFAWSRDGRLAVAHGLVPTDVVLFSGIH